MDNSKREYRMGLIAGAGTSAIWGILPVYWRWIDAIDSWVIIVYRIFLAGVLCFFLALKSFGMEGIKAPLREKGVMLRYFISGLLVTVNWSTYIWAVNAGHVIEASIGYYIEPLVVSLFGVVIFKERMNGIKKLGVGLVLCAVLAMMIHFQKPPMISLTLAISFAAYTAVKKKYSMSPALSLFYETMFLIPVTFGVILYLEGTGKAAFSMIEAPYQYVLLLFSGVVTAVPLLTLAYAAARIKFVTLGLSQYISPTLTLLIGIFLFREPFDLVQFAAVVLIWIGIIFFTAGEMKDTGESVFSQEEDVL